ncbi:MAG: hypothetical protein mread185_000451 [Mycoplasmataceae bacterium]|nr:MAG: hypothetical protein mread185_000451 [Mycoplasmataceae bacterium]
MTADLTNEINVKDELINNLQTEIDRLKTPPSLLDVNLMNPEEKTIQESSLELESKNKQGENTSLIYSQEDLENLIKKHQLEIEGLKSSFVGKHRKPQELTPLSEVLQNSPKKNRTDLHLCLLGYSLLIIALCLNLLKRTKRHEKK